MENIKLGGEYKSWVENIKLGGEMCGGHRRVMDIGGSSGLEHQVEWRTSSWVENIKLGGEYKSWMDNIKLVGNMWCTQVGDGHWWVEWFRTSS